MVHELYYKVLLLTGKKQGMSAVLMCEDVDVLPSVHAW
jgi:hypothetical protein